MRAALRIIDVEGIDGFSLEKLARHLGVKSPSLYHHFANRSDLLAEAAREWLSDIPLGSDPQPVNWQDWFVELSMRTYRHIMAHPKAVQLLYSHFPATSVMPSHERGAQILERIGIPAEARYAIMRGLEKCVFGIAFADADDFVQGRENPPTEIDDERWPGLAKAVAASRMGREEIAEHAVRMYLQGVASAYPVI